MTSKTCFTQAVTSNTHIIDIGEVVLCALPARLRTDDTQAYIRTASGKNNCSPHLEVAFKSGNLQKNFLKIDAASTVMEKWPRAWPIGGKKWEDLH